ncbi:MAG: type II toxin-antitoxin system VapC family toxin [Nitrospira sp.]
MIVVDTSVWSLAFRRRARPSDEPKVVSLLRRMIKDDQPLAVPGIVFQELLTGVRDVTQTKKLQRLLDGFPLLLATKDHHVEAAKISTACRKGGVAAATVDCLIAAQCISSHSPLLTTDEDFKRIARHAALKLYPIPLG